MLERTSSSSSQHVASGRIYCYRQQHSAMPEITSYMTAEEKAVLEKQKPNVIANQKTILDSLIAHDAKHIFPEGHTEELSQLFSSEKADTLRLSIAESFQGYQPDQTLNEKQKDLLFRGGATIVYPFMPNSLKSHAQMHVSELSKSIQHALQNYQEAYETYVRKPQRTIAQIKSELTIFSLQSKLRRAKRIYASETGERLSAHLGLLANIVDRRDREIAGAISTFMKANPNEDVHVAIGSQHKLSDVLKAANPHIPMTVIDAYEPKVG